MRSSRALPRRATLRATNGDANVQQIRLHGEKVNDVVNDAANIQPERDGLPDVGNEASSVRNRLKSSMERVPCESAWR